MLESSIMVDESHKKYHAVIRKVFFSFYGMARKSKKDVKYLDCAMKGENPICFLKSSE